MINVSSATPNDFVAFVPFTNCAMAHVSHLVVNAQGLVAVPASGLGSLQIPGNYSVCYSTPNAKSDLDYYKLNPSLMAYVPAQICT
jgi:hypothetical protein